MTLKHSFNVTVARQSGIFCRIFLCRFTYNVVSVLRSASLSQLSASLVVIIFTQGVVVVGWLLNVPATCECISGTVLKGKTFLAALMKSTTYTGLCSGVCPPSFFKFGSMIALTATH